MKDAQRGSVVAMHCVTKEPDGTLIEPTSEAGALEAKLGAGQLPQPVEQALVGMAERRT